MRFNLRASGWLFLPLFCALVLFLAPSAQAGRLHGHVLDNESGEPLIGANLKVLPPDGKQEVTARGRTILRGAATNMDGYFVVSGLESGSWTVLATYQGYQPLSITLQVLEGFDPMQEIRLKPATLALREVVVTAEKTEQDLQKEQVYAGSIRMDRKQMDLAPVLLERDLMRSLMTLPGVLPSNDFSSDLNVRGSRADENLIVLDGVEVYNPNHMGGLFSAFIPSAVKHTDLMRSSWPAEYGGRLGAVLQVTSREGNREKLDGEISLGALTSSIQLSAPTWKLDQSSWLLALRRSYIDLATRAFTKEEVPYHFTDAQFRANWDLSPEDRLSSTVYWGDDVFNAGSLKFTFGNRAVNLNWRHVWNTKWYSRTILGFSRFRTELDFGGKETVMQSNYINDFSLRMQMEYHHDEKLMIETGMQLKTLSSEFQSWIFSEHKWDVERDMSEAAAFVQASWRPHPLLIIEPGLRAAIFRAGGLFEDVYDVARLEPRLGLKWHVSEEIRAKAAWGMYNQGLHQFRRDGSTFSFIWLAMDSTSRPAQARHMTAGIEVDLAPGTMLELEGYYKTMNHLAEAKELMEDHKAEDPSTNEYLFHQGRGEAFGADISLRRSEGLWTGQFGYSLGWAVRRVPEFNDGEPFYAAFDKRHNLNLQVNRTFLLKEKRGFPFKRFVRFFWYNESTAGLAWRLASGPRFTEPFSATWLGNDGLNGEESVQHNFGARNAQELSIYNRFDLMWTLTRHKPKSDFQYRIGLLNVFNSPNYWGVDFNYTDDPGGLPTMDKIDGIRRLPSVEMIWRF